jgi:cell division protein FtsZ
VSTGRGLLPNAPFRRRLLEGVNLSGAKGVLVNITATRSLKMKEVNEVMNTVRAFAADDAHIIFGAVYDENRWARTSG